MGWIGSLLILLGILRTLLAAAIARFGHPGAVLSGAPYLALTTALLVLGGEAGLAGYEPRRPSPYAQLAIPVQVGGFALLAAAAWLMLSPTPRGRTGTSSDPTSADDQSEEPVMAPASLSPLDLRNAQMIRWLADRPHLVLVGAEQPTAEPVRSRPGVRAGGGRRAHALQEGIAADSARILGDDHPHTVTARPKLGQWRKLARKSRKAKAPV